MTFLQQRSASGARSRGRKARRTVVGTLVASLLVAVPVGASDGASVGGTRAQIATLRAQIDAGAAEIHQLTGTYASATLQAASLRQQLGSQDAQLARLRRGLAGSQALLQKAAVASYTGEAGNGTMPTLEGSTDPAVGDEYLSVASGDVAQTIDTYQLQQRQVTTEIDTIRGEQQANQRLVLEAADARSAALGTAAAEDQRLSTLQNELDGLVATAAIASSTQGLPVNDGLTKVALAETSPPASTAPTTPPATSPTTSPVTTPTTTDPTTATPPTTSPPTTTPPTTAPPSGTTSGGGAGGVWLALRDCESGDNYQENTGNGFYGAYQFSAQTWTGLGFPGRPDLEPPAMQDQAAMELQARSGWDQWPACAAALGLD